MVQINEHLLFHRAKAVSDGAVIWRCMKKVEGRRARYSFGAGTCRPYRPEDKIQAGRTPKAFPEGELWITGYWSQIVTKVSRWKISYESVA